jgi:hypothetical protein
MGSRGFGFRSTGFRSHRGGEGFENRSGRSSFRGRFRHHHHERFFFGAGFGFPFYSYYPFYGFPYDYSDYSAPVADYSSPSYNAYDYYSDQQRRVEDRLDRLEDRIDRLRDEERYRAEAQVTQPNAGRVAGSQSLAVVLVFRDKHREEVQNYGLVGRTLWIFTEQRARKIPLSELDLPATTKANEERGVEFQVPSANTH